MTYAISSDQHCHKWSLFSNTAKDGVNSRLRIILDELERTGDDLMAAGGRVMVMNGDLFHTRGVIDPEVFNPVYDVIERMTMKGILFMAIPGNHDLESEDTMALASAIQSLRRPGNLSGGGFEVVNKADMIELDDQLFGFVPWRKTHDLLLADLESLAKSRDAKEMDVFIHAGIEGVLPHMPASGLTDKKLAAFGFRHVFAGHYHNHKVMDGGVVSVGATTQQTWRDVGSRAGYVLVDENGIVTHRASRAPQFVDVSGLDEVEIELACDGNYVRFRGPQMSQDDIRDLREQFKSWGAKGTSFEVPRAIVAARPGVTSSSGRTLDQSVTDYIDANKDLPAHINRDAVKRRAADVLSASRAVYEES